MKDSNEECGKGIESTDITTTSKAPQLPDSAPFKTNSCATLAPPVDTVESDDDCGSEDGIHYPKLRRFSSFRDVSPKNVLGYLVVLMIFQLLLASCLHKAGVTETDLLEEFVAHSMLQNGWARINGSISAAYMTQQKLRPGYQLAQEGARAKYPIVMVPGFVTSGLELWGGEECARKHFRQRLWGAIGTARTFFTDRDCFLRHLALDPNTGGDPKNIRLRAAQGFEAADYFMATYWVWDKLISNLADVGYDQSNMVMMSYDWRLAFSVLEERDGYLTKLRYSIEAMHQSSGQKVVLATHSMGSSLTLYFLKWVSEDRNNGGGGGGTDWVDKHVHSFVNIAGPTLGVPKAVPALLSGEFKDTSALLGTIGTMVEHFFGRRRRKDLWITWGSLWSMLPKGGNAMWGSDICNTTSHVESLRCFDSGKEQHIETTDSSMVPLIEMTQDHDGDETEQTPLESQLKTCREPRWNPSGLNKKSHRKILSYLSHSSKSTEETVEFLTTWGGGHGPSLSSARLHPVEPKMAKHSWHDPSVTPLPYAPSLKIYCLYGVGLETERAYFYRQSDVVVNEENQQCLTVDMDLPLTLDSSVDDPDNSIRYGVKFTDGDGSVPLLSLGYMCVDGWSQSTLNPSGSKIITREYKHSPEFHVDDPMRGGPGSAEHVDILGNLDMTEDLIRIVTDFEVPSSKIVSNIQDIAKRVRAGRTSGLKEPSLTNRWNRFFVSLIR